MVLLSASNMRLTDFVVLGLTVAVLWYHFRKTKRPPLPPGPPGLPLIGNLLDMPSEKQWLAFTEWAKIWGDLVSITILGQPILIISSYPRAVQLLEKRGTKYADRPVFTMGGEMVGWKHALGFHSYGESLREHRRLFHQEMGSNSALVKFFPAQEREVELFLERVEREPEGLFRHICQHAAAVILRATYGHTVVDERDSLVSIVKLAMDGFSESFAPGAFLVDTIPILRFLPSWLPGCGFKRKAEVWRDDLMAMANVPFDEVKSQIVAGTAIESFTSKLLMQDDKVDEEVIKWVAASMYGGGGDTTVASIYSFFLAMMLYPDVQAEAQAEIDSVVGRHRLPTFDDRKNLPYTNALCLEVLRWHTIAPTAVAHCTSEDDICDGYFIPKGTLVIPNLWYMLHDPEVYPDPDVFDPTRYLSHEGPEGKTQPYPKNIAFSLGRRICPGRLFADCSMFIVIAGVLSRFTISKAVKDGRLIEPSRDVTSGAVSHPVPFECCIEKRTNK